MVVLLLFLCGGALLVALIVLAGRAGNRSQAKSLICETYLLAASGGRRDRGS